MDLVRLKYFKAVAETVNIRKAAELLSLTPSALSKAVKQLESDLGARLVTAAGRGIALTDDGKLAYRLACRLLEGYEEFLTGFEQRKVLRQVKYQIEGLEAALELTRQGLCAGFFPKFLVKLHNSEMGAPFHLEPLSLPVKLRPQTLTLYIVRRSSDEDDLITRKLAKALRQVCGG